MPRKGLLIYRFCACVLLFIAALLLITPSYASSLNVTDYPKLVNLFNFTQSTQVTKIPALGRYGLVVTNSIPAAASLLKGQNPLTKVIFYQASEEVPISDFSKFTIYSGWWLLLTGTTIPQPINATTTIIPVVNASVIAANLATSPDVLIDNESMHVTAVDTNINVLTVQRGYHSTAAAHNLGAKIAVHASFWPGTWMLNVTQYCPIDPSTGMTWADYYAQQVKSRMTAQPLFDGVFIDNVNNDFSFVDNGQTDVNNDGVADKTLGPTSTAWHDGEVQLIQKTRAQIGATAIILGNGMYYDNSGQDGREFEHFPFFNNDVSDVLSQYLDFAGSASTRPYSLINPDTNNTGTESLRAMREGIASALMGNGYFTYDFGAQQHGNTWWYDEYDDAAGSSLTSAITASATQLNVFQLNGSKFKANDIIFVPGQFDQEQMLIIALQGDILTVQRGYNGTAAEAHNVGQKVFTDQQESIGIGWLGQPLGPPIESTNTASNLLQNGTFTGSILPWVFHNNNGSATASVDTSNHTSTSAQSAKIAITTGGTYGTWAFELTQNNLALTANQTYTLSFWLKSTNSQITSVVIKQQSSPFTIRKTYTFFPGTSWREYQIVYVPSVTENDVVDFTFSQPAGNVWIADVALQQGDPNLWQRDFAHGKVILNNTNASQTIPIANGYQRIHGSQDFVTNNGQPVGPLITIPAHDGLLLEKNPYTLALDIKLHGIGQGGDNVNPSGGGNTAPKRSHRLVAITLYDVGNTPVATISGGVDYAIVTGSFTGTISLPASIAAGNYSLSITSPGYLGIRVPGIYQLVSNQTTTVPTQSFISGDVNLDSSLSILDYNQVLNCNNTTNDQTLLAANPNLQLVPTALCPNNNFLRADMTDDGIVNFLDMNLLLREFARQNGS